MLSIPLARVKLTIFAICAFLHSQDQYTSDTGNYSWYAGPRSVTGTANRCITLNGIIHNPAGTSLASAVTLAAHC